MTHKPLTLTFTFLALIALFLGVSSAAAHQDTTSDLLLPHFEVDMTGAGVTTFFTVVNGSDQAIQVKMDVFTNWGVKMFETTADFKSEEARVFNLSQWVLAGQLPDRTMGAEEREHCQAALSGQASPRDGLYYSEEVSLQKAVIATPCFRSPQRSTTTTTAVAR